MSSLSAPFRLVLDGTSFLDTIRTGVRIPERTVSLAIASLCFLASYGALMGAQNGWMQAVSSAIKLPILYLVTIAICFPTLYVLNLLNGGKASARQYFVLVIAAVAINSLVVIAFAPVTAFFLVTSTNYSFYKLLNVAVLTLGGLFAVAYIYKTVPLIEGENDYKVGKRKQIVTAWILLFAFVGSQMGWTLRPFFGAPDLPFEVVRKVGGNFYVDVAKSVEDAFRL